MKFRIPMYVIFALGLVGLAACENNEGPADDVKEAKQAVQDTVEEAGDKVEDAGDEIEDAADEATD